MPGARAFTGQAVESRPFLLMSQGQEVKNGLTGDLGKTWGNPWLRILREKERHLAFYLLVVP